MERIKQAIEKAKQNSGNSPGRGGAYQSAPASASAAMAAAVSPAVAPEISGATAESHTPSPPAIMPCEEIGEVSYSQTTVVTLNPDVLEQHRIVAHNKNAPTSWVFDVLRTQVLQKMEENGWRTLAITSPTPEAGKTVVAINLAMSIAKHTTKTAMLVDFDLRRPKVSKYLGINHSPSLNELLADQASLQDALVNPNLPRLVILPTHKPITRSAETLSSPKVENLINELRNRYESRIVIFDLPPLLNADDTIAILPKIDCVLLIVANGMSTQQELEDSMRHLPEANLLGVVLNKAEVEASSYYY